MALGSNLKKKLGYYLTEISIISIGITISFSVQTYLNKLDNKEKQIEAYERILVDLERDRAYFNQAYINNERQIQSSKEIVSGYLTQENFNRNITYYGTFFNDNTIASIKSTGLLEDFDNKTLINDLLTYYRQDYDFLTDAVEWDEKIALESILLVAREVEIDSISTENNFTHTNKTKTALYSIGDKSIESLKLNSNFMGLLQTKIWVKFVYNNFLSNALIRNQDITKRIEKELQLMQ